MTVCLAVVRGTGDEQDRCTAHAPRINSIDTLVDDDEDDTHVANFIFLFLLLVLIVIYAKKEERIC